MLDRMKVLVFGPTGAAGGSVLKLCLAEPRVTEVRAIARRLVPPTPAKDAKLRTFLHTDFLDYTAVAEAEYRKITQGFALAAARALQAGSPTAAFHYLSGQGAALDSRMMWARVKAEAERDLLALGTAVCWRPGFIDGETSANAPRLYQAVRPLARLFKGFRSLYVSGEDIGRAMLQATDEGVRGKTFENREIRDLAERWERVAHS
jgi:uncharacterized protein YbjT (DUF2867 family)